MTIVVGYTHQAWYSASVMIVFCLTLDTTNTWTIKRDQPDAPPADTAGAAHAPAEAADQCALGAGDHHAGGDNET